MITKFYTFLYASHTLGDLNGRSVLGASPDASRPPEPATDALRAHAMMQEELFTNSV